jgi:DNA-3-methyladenine glycosylase II
MLEYDPLAAAKILAKADGRLAKVIKLAGPCTIAPPRLQSPFELLAKAIVYQQLSRKAAATIFGRVHALYPRCRVLNAERVIETPQGELRRCGMSAAKIAALKDLAAKSLDGTVPKLRKLRQLSDHEIIERLTAVRGIGVWTVEMLLIFQLGRSDVLPVGDLGVRKGYMRTYGHKSLPTPTELRAAGEDWRPFRSVASWYLWRALDLENGQRLL